MAEPFLGSETEISQEALVEAYLSAHAGSTIGEIRDGIEVTYGVRIERIQGRLDKIERRRHLHRRTRSGNVLEYSLGEPRTEPLRKAFGIEATFWVGSEPDVHVQRSDLDDPRLLAEVEGLRRVITDYIQGHIVPLVSPAEDDFDRWFA